MRFPTMFRRRVGDQPEGEKEELRELGKDERPEGKPTKGDNFHTSRLVNTNGFPSQRVVVGRVGPKEAVGPRVPVEMRLHEDRTEGWLRVPGDGFVEVGGLAYFDPPCLLDHGKGRSDDDSHNPGSLDVLLVPGTPPVAAGVEPAFPPGVYSFVVGTDVSNPGQ